MISFDPRGMPALHHIGGSLHQADLGIHSPSLFRSMQVCLNSFTRSIFISRYQGCHIVFNDVVLKAVLPYNRLSNDFILKGCTMYYSEFNGFV